MRTAAGAARPARSVPRRGALAALAASLVLLAGACSTAKQGTNTDPDLVDSTARPENGLCRTLTPDDVRLPANATAAVPCSRSHTAETFAVADLPKSYDDSDYGDADIARYAYRECSRGFADFVGADESLVLRTTLSWAWFRPSEKAWRKGARWFRCDIVGGNSASTSYRPLPAAARGILAGRPDEAWLSCARGATVATGAKVACSEKHDWRAVTTVKIGQPGDDYPGDRVMESRSRSFCSASVKAWLNYPAEFEYGYTFFHRAEWEAGIRRSVCWARTTS